MGENTEEQIKKTIDNILKKIEKGIKHNKVDKTKIDWILQNQEYMNQEQKEKFNELMPLINDLESREALVPRNNRILNFFRRLKNRLTNRQNDVSDNSSINDFGQEEIQEESPKTIIFPTETKIDKYKVSPEDIKTSENKERENYKQEEIVVSDLHGRIDRWEFVKEALKKNKGLSVIVLGDCMDRGDYGLEILMEIKDLSDQGRIKYLPGNHDIFAYNYLKTLNTLNNEEIFNQSKALWERNGGKVTMEKFKNYNQIMQKEISEGRISKPIRLDELVEWLGSQPIQYKTQKENIKYALSHAVFDEDLYRYDKYFSLDKALSMEIAVNSGKVDDRATLNNYQNILNKFRNCTWFRDGEVKYSELSWPRDHVVVVGHTRQTEVDLKNVEGKPNQAMIYVDCGKGENFQGFSLTEGKTVDFEESYER